MRIPLNKKNNFLPLFLLISSTISCRLFAGLEHKALERCAIFRFGHLNQKPLIGKISLDGTDCKGFHGITSYARRKAPSNYVHRFRPALALGVRCSSVGYWLK